MGNPKIIKLKKSSKSEDNNITNRWFDVTYYSAKGHKDLSITSEEVLPEHLDSIKLLVSFSHPNGSNGKLPILKYPDFGIKQNILEESTFDILLIGGITDVEYKFKILLS